MKKIIKLTSVLLVSSMLLSNIAYADELIDRGRIANELSSAVTYGSDKIKNMAADIFSVSTEKNNNDKKEEYKFNDPGMNLSHKDIQRLYDIGYELPDIEEAIRLSTVYEKTPYELLQLKGKTKYIPHEIENPADEQAALFSEDGQTETTDETAPDYEFTTEEKSWDSVIMDLNDGNVVINENQWEFIKLSGLDKYIDEETLSDEEKAALNSVDLTNFNENIDLYAASTTDTKDIFNNYIFPKSQHEQITQGGYTVSDDVYVNELTGNNVVKATDLSLKGRNGLDLNLSRYYSVIDSNECDAIVNRLSAGSSTQTNTYYTVLCKPTVTIEYNEPLSDGSIQKKLDVEAVYIASGRINYNKGNNSPYGMFISMDAYNADLARLRAGQEPQYLFKSESAAKECLSHAENGKYNYTVTFASDSNKGKIQRITYDLSTDTPSVIKAGSGTVTADTSSYENDMEEASHTYYFDIGYGWSFDFPYIEKQYDSTEKVIYEYLHMGASGGSWQIDDNNLVGYQLNDIKLSNGSGSFNGETIDYTLTEKTGKKYYFGTIGQLLGIQDRYGNQILFEYDKNKWGKITYPKLRKITDSVGRVVDITYLDSKIIITVIDKNDASQNRVIEYTKTNDELTSVKDAEGYVTTYAYNVATYNVSMVDKDMKNPSKLKYHLLQYIYYPTGLQRELSYDRMKKNCGIGGSMEVPACGENFVVSEDEYGKRTKYTRKQYSRDRGHDNKSAVYDGYPTFRSLEEVPDEYRTYSIYIDYPDTNGDPITYTSIYALSEDNNLLKESVTAQYKEYFGDDKIITFKSVTEYLYDKWEQCIKETKRVYNDFDNDKNAYVQTTKDYTYDSSGYGDLLSEKTNGQANRTTSYVYDSTYHLPTKMTYKKDADTTVVTNYALTSDKKSVAFVTVTENNSTKRKRAYTYDSYGNVLSEKRYSGNNSWNDYITISYDYNDSRNVTNKLNGVYLNKISISGVKDADGNVANSGTISQLYSYDWYGNIVMESDANGRQYNYTYDKLNRLKKVTNPDSSSKEYTYTVNQNANDVTVKNENGGIIKYSYDPIGTAISATDVTNNDLLTEYIRDGEYNHLILSDIQHSTQNGKITSKKMYNSMGEIIRETITDAKGNNLYNAATDYEYAIDGVFKKITQTVYGDTDSETVKNIQYIDEYGNLTKEETVYNENGVSKSAVTEYTHDLAGNVKTVREPRAKAENWAADEYTAKYEYDVAGNVIKETDINGNSVLNTYDGLGNLVSSQDKNGNTTTMAYDALGRVLKQEIPFQKNGLNTIYSTNKYYYDANGNVVKSQTANNAVGSADAYITTEYQYNWQNQPTKVRGLNGSEVESCVQYYYDSVGNVLRAYTGDVDGLTVSGIDKVSGSTSNYAVTKYTYDNMNRCVSQTDALGQTVSNKYDINGNLIQTTDRNGNVLSYSYDGLNRLIQKSSDKTDADTYSYSYNKKGFRTGMTGGGTDTTSVYDSLGRLIKEALTDGSTKEYTYDINGNRKSFKLTKDNAVQYTLTYDYDKMNRLTTVYEDGAVKAEYTYNADGTLKKASYGKQTTDYTYNLANLLTEINNANGSTQISKYNYTYYVNGNQKSKTESVAGKNNGTTNYTYDDLNRLVQEQTPGKTMNYQYDAYGNRSSLNVLNGESYAYTYDKNNRLTNETKTADGASELTDYWYDPNGNQISSMTISTGLSGGKSGVSLQPVGQAASSINEYNSWNQLTKTMQNGKTASYTYNGDGLRVSKTVNGAATNHIWDGANIAADVTNGTVTKYIRGIQLISSKQGNNEIFYNYNGHGDVVQLTSNTGSITKQYSYDAFGVEKNKDEADTNPFRYCGEYFDEETGYTYLRNRYYDSDKGRFTTEDPIKDGLNWYVYCSNSPVVLVDPSGLGPWIDEKGESKIPIFYDWNRDGYLDTVEDKSRFDTNNNGIADWNEKNSPYYGSREWFQCNEFNIIDGFEHVYQDGYDLCWAADIDMVVRQLAGKTIGFIKIAQDVHGPDDYNKGHGGPVSIGREINKQGYLDGSGYAVDNNLLNGGDIYGTTQRPDVNKLTFDKIINQIDSGIPFIMGGIERNHVMVAIGYGYNIDINKQVVLLDNSSYDVGYYDVYSFEEIKNAPTLTFKKVSN